MRSLSTLFFVISITLCITLGTFAQNTGNGVTVTVQSLPKVGGIDPYKGMTLQKSYGVGKYWLDIKSKYPYSFLSTPSGVVYAPGKGTRVVLYSGFKATICGITSIGNVEQCLPVVSNFNTSFFKSLRTIEVARIRDDRFGYLFFNTGESLAVSPTTNSGVVEIARELPFLGGSFPVRSWVPRGHTMYLCDKLTGDRKSCDGYRYEMKADDNSIQSDYHDAPRRTYKYAVLKKNGIVAIPGPRPKPVPLPRPRPKN